MPDAPGGLSRVADLVSALGRLRGSDFRVWWVQPGQTRLLAGPPPAAGWLPALEDAAEQAGLRLDAPAGPVWVARVLGVEGVWLEMPAAAAPAAGDLTAIVGTLLAAERETAQVAVELSERYEEIDLIYTIGEILGHTIRLEEAAERILTEVASVVRARRATLLVADEARQVLRLVAARGMEPDDVEPIEIGRASCRERVWIPV